MISEKPTRNSENYKIVKININQKWKISEIK